MDDRVNIVCEKCGSGDVSRDANAVWDAESQEWVLGGVQDQGYCNLCGGEAHLAEVPLLTSYTLVKVYDRCSMDVPPEVDEWLTDEQSNGICRWVHLSSGHVPDNVKYFFLSHGAKPDEKVLYWRGTPQRVLARLPRPRVRSGK